MTAPQLQIAELNDSRGQTFNGRSELQLKYVITGTDDDALAQALLLSTAPTTYNGVPRAECQLEPQPPDNWIATVHYLYKRGFTFSTTGGTQKITQSIQTQASYGPGSLQPPNYFGAIGVTKDGVDGCEITVPQFEFQFKVVYPGSGPGSISSNDVIGLYALTGCVNNSPFLGVFAPGEVLFRGAAGGQTGGDNWEITYSFAASANIDGVIVQSPLGQIGPIHKDGWDYLWIRYTDRTDTVAQALVKIPTAIYVEQVYRRKDLNVLRLNG